MERPRDTETDRAEPGDSRLRRREDFFASLPPRAPGLVPKRVRGSVRVDLTTGGGPERWYLEFADGQASVSRVHEERPADGVLATTDEVFDQLTQGLISPLAAGIRADYVFLGAGLLLPILIRFFASTGHDPRMAAREHSPSGRRWRKLLDAALAARGDKSRG